MGNSVAGSIGQHSIYDSCYQNTLAVLLLIAGPIARGDIQYRTVMSIKFQNKDLSPAEASFLKLQYGFDEGDEPFERALWQAIMRAWDADNASGKESHLLNRLGCAGAFPEEVALYVKFRSDGSDMIWNDLIRRAGLSDRRTAKVSVATDRRRATSRS